MRNQGKFFSRTVAAAWAACVAAGVVVAQQALNPPAPLVQAPAGITPGQNAMSLESAERALDLGQSSIAVEIYQQLLRDPGENRERLTLALAGALLDAGRAAEAEQALADLPEPRSAAWHLRMGLAALQLDKRDAAQAAWDAIKEENLPIPDRAWYWFLAGALWDTAASPDVTKANEFYLKAEAAAPTDFVRARFQLAGERVRLKAGVATEVDLRTYDRHRGTQFGYLLAESLAVSLNLGGKKNEAVTFLKSVLLTLPRQEAVAWDRLSLMLGLIGERGRGGDGRIVLEQLLESGNNPERQRQALQLLAGASKGDAERGLFRTFLNRLISSTAPHRILENLLYFRAQLALAEADYLQSERDANTLLNQFPGSPLRAHAYGILTQSAWEQLRFRSVADNARKARAELPETAAQARVSLRILEAEASFRAGLNAGASGQADFRNAADAYAAVLRERPPGMEKPKPGELMLLRVRAEIKSGSGDAAKVLDELESDPLFDLESRWQAEWHLARSLQLEGRTPVAYARVSKLLAGTRPAANAPAGSALTPELKARMAWLQALLSFESGQLEQTLTLVDALLAAPIEIEAGIRNELSSDLVLLKARAELALGREPAALETLKRLRLEFLDSDAAMHSYLIEAAHYENQGRIVDAKIRLTSLIDNQKYKDSELVPVALFNLALLSEQLGGQENLREANKRIEDLVNMPAAASNIGLIFRARLKQGDLLRKMDQYPQAQQAYEYLENTYPRHPDVVYAQLALAVTHSAQAAADPSQLEKARRKFEELRDRVDAPDDVRVEAGYNLGLLLATHGEETKAADVWWRDVVTEFLIENKRPIETGAKRRYWLGRTLYDLGELHEKKGRLEEAKQVYLLLWKSKLGYGDARAKEKLERYGIPTASL